MGNLDHQAIELLLAAGADPLWNHDKGSCAVQRACTQGNAALLMQLTQPLGAIPPVAYDWVIQGACAAVEQEEARFSKGQDAQGFWGQPHWDADPREVLKNHFECLDYLQTKAPLPASTDLLLLSIAADNLPLFQKLLELGTNPDEKQSWGRLPLIEAIGYEWDSPYLERLLAAGVDVNRICPRGDSPLLTAITVDSRTRQEGTGLIPRLLKIGARHDLGTLDKGVTPLMLAIRQNNLDAARLLLEVGANPFLTDHSGQFAYHYARGSSRRLRRLLEQQQQKVFMKMKLTVARDHEEEYE
jgi:ankyrin repeat protein